MKVKQLVPLAIFILMTILLGWALTQDPKILPSAKIGKPMAKFTLSSLSHPEKILTEKDLLGEPYFLNVWATWCPSCLAEHSSLLAMNQEGARIVGLNYKDERMKALSYLQRHKDPFVVSIFDPDGDLGFELGVTGAPETFLVDANGRIVHKVVGVINDELWETDLKFRFEKLVERSDAEAL